MSTLTKNFNLFKPELNDPADITEINGNWDRIDSELASAGNRIVVATSTDGVSYEATVPYVEELYNGLEITIIPNMTSTVTNPDLNVNGFGKVKIRLPLSGNTTGTSYPTITNFYVKDKPVKLIYDSTHSSGGAWRTVDKQRISPSSIYGSIPIENGGTGAENPKEARKNLGAIAIQTTSATLPISGWSNNKQTIDVDGVTADNTVFIVNAPNSYASYKNYCIRCTSQGDGTLTFTCDYTPEVNVTVNIAIFE